MTAPDVDQNAPIRLGDIIPIAFPFGGMTISGLRKEAKRGHLTILRMAGKDWTTLAYIEEMKEKCRAQNSPQGSGSGQPTRPAPQYGSSSTEKNKSAQDALQQIVNRLKGNSPNISPAGLSKSRKASTGQLPRSQ